MRIGLDLDGLLDEQPVFFAFLPGEEKEAFRREWITFEASL